MNNSSTSRNDSAATLFSELFNRVKKTVEFSESFNNGTHYFNPVCEINFQLLPGEAVKFVTTNGRKAVVIKTSNHGNVVIFNRYSDSDVVVYNTSDVRGHGLPQRDGQTTVKQFVQLLEAVVQDVKNTSTLAAEFSMILLPWSYV